MPSGLVDQNDANSRGKFSAAMPCPRSATATSTDPSSRIAVLTATIRFDAGVSVIESIALISRFSMTCCN